MNATSQRDFVPGHGGIALAFTLAPARLPGNRRSGCIPGLSVAARRRLAGQSCDIWSRR